MEKKGRPVEAAPARCRRALRFGWLAIILAPWLARADSFTFEEVAKAARTRAAQPFQAAPELPQALQEIGYDQWRGIRFKKEKALWASDGIPFTVEMFHPGYLYKHPVLLRVVERGRVEPVPFSRESFDYGETGVGEHVPPNAGFAGFRIHYPLNRSDYFDEVAVFLGASYFRALGKDQFLGLSARGLAVDSGTDEVEEFPLFREFWIEKPAPGAKEITVYALMDGPSIAGAYRFVIEPGVATVMRVTAMLFTRKGGRKLGFAPLTSMFLVGENSPRRPDFRPEVHDSDGLLIATRSGDWIWRPLVNPQRRRLHSIEPGCPSGFGLLQRDTNFDHYQDLEARYDIRPSAWVTPDADWGEGHLELVQIPTEDEYHDNIVVYWTPAKPPEPGATHRFSYRLEWFSGKQERSPKGRATATHLMPPAPGPNVRFLVDFEGDALKAAQRPDEVAADVHAGADHAIEHPQVVKNPVTGGWRLIFQLTTKHEVPRLEKNLPGGAVPAEIKARLRRGSEPVTEIWTYGAPQ